jgi:hypothetical protein
VTIIFAFYWLLTASHHNCKLRRPPGSVQVHIPRPAVDYIGSQSNLLVFKWSLEIRLASECLILDDLNPISIRIKKEGYILHTAVGEPLLPVAAEVLKSLAGSVQVIHSNAYQEKVNGYNLSTG